jgi:hypothetical protein
VALWPVSFRARAYPTLKTAERLDEVAREGAGGGPNATVPVRLDAAAKYLVGEDQADDVGVVAAGQPVGADPLPLKGTAGTSAAWRRRRFASDWARLRQRRH